MGEEEKNEGTEKKKKRECQKDKVELPKYNTTKWLKI